MVKYKMTQSSLIPSPSIAHEQIKEKIINNQRISIEEGLLLIQSKKTEELAFLKSLIDWIYKTKLGKKVFFSSTLYLYPTNQCVFNCSFCSFYAKPGSTNKWFHTPENLVKRIKHYEDLITEVHIVGGCWPECDLNYYSQLFSLIKESYPHIHIKALSAIEYDYLSHLHNISLEEVFEKLKMAGLNSIPGGGAEILVDKIRKRISGDRISSKRFLEIHAAAHKQNLPSNITVLFDHIETPKDIITHLDLVRKQQDLTQGFKNFVPLKFAKLNNSLGKLISKRNLSNKLNIKAIYATARLMLDNIPNIKSLWNYLGIDNGLEMLNWGCNDFSSTHLEEKVFFYASSKTCIRMDIQGMHSLLKSIDKEPILTNSQEI